MANDNIPDVIRPAEQMEEAWISDPGGQGEAVRYDPNYLQTFTSPKGGASFSTSKFQPTLPPAEQGAALATPYTTAYLGQQQANVGAQAWTPASTKQPLIPSSAPSVTAPGVVGVHGYDPQLMQTPEGGWLQQAPTGGWTPDMTTFDPVTYGESLTPYWEQQQQAMGAPGAPAELVSTQLGNIMRRDSPLMQQARAYASQESNRRGLLNSSMAVGAAQDAMVRQAMPIAQADAGVYERALTATTADKSEAARMQAIADNQRAMAEGGFGVQTALAEGQHGVQTSLENAIAKNRELAATADFANKERLDTELANLQAELSYNVQGIQTKSSEYLAQIQANTTLTNAEKQNAMQMATAGLSAQNAIRLSQIQSDTTLTVTDKNNATREVLAEGDNYTKKILEVMDNSAALLGNAVDNNTKIAISQMEFATKDMINRYALDNENLIKTNDNIAAIFQTAIANVAGIMTDSNLPIFEKDSYITRILSEATDGFVLMEDVSDLVEGVMGMPEYALSNMDNVNLDEAQTVGAAETLAANQREQDEADRIKQERADRAANQREQINQGYLDSQGYLDRTSPTPAPATAPAPAPAPATAPAPAPVAQGGPETTLNSYNNAGPPLAASLSAYIANNPPAQPLGGMYHWDGDITNIPKDLYDSWASTPGVMQPDDYSVDMKGRPILVGFPYDWQPGMAEQEYINNKPTHIFGQPISYNQG